jgi:hypothetical protein
VAANPRLLRKQAGSSEAVVSFGGDRRWQDVISDAHDTKGIDMEDPSNFKRKTVRYAGVAGLLAAGAIGGAVLAGTMTANAATTAGSGSTSTSSTATSGSSTSGSSTSGSSTGTTAPAADGSGQAAFPPHGSAAHEALEKPVTGTAATQAQAAAVKAAGSGTAGAVTTDASGTGYETTVTKSDGSTVEIHMDKSFTVMGPGTGQAGH